MMTDGGAALNVFCPALPADNVTKPPDNVTKAVKMSLFLGSKTNRRFFCDQNPAQKPCVLHGKNVYPITLIVLIALSLRTLGTMPVLPTIWCQVF